MLSRAISIVFCLFTLIPSASKAQGCPVQKEIFKLDFGTNASPRHDFIMETSAYDRARGGCPDDGNYSISSFSRNCFEGRWLDGMSDHTPGDKQGRMLIFNASPDPKRLFNMPVKNLTGGRDYELSLSVANLLRRADNCSPNQPEIVVRIETVKGSLIKRYSSGTIYQNASFEWQELSVGFTLPPSENSVMLRFENNIPGGCGNDFALDDIRLVMCKEPVNTPVLKKEDVTIEPVKESESPDEIRLREIRAEIDAENRRKAAVEAEIEALEKKRAALLAQEVKVVPVTKEASTKMKNWDLRNNTLVKEVVVSKPGKITLSLYDADQVDGDTVSVLVNGKVVLKSIGLLETPVKTVVELSAEQMEVDVLLVAENLGKTPPNTARLVVYTEGGRREEVTIRTGPENNALLRFRLKR
jgi:hypothetical protein